MKELFFELEKISKEGASVIVKIYGDLWNVSPAQPYTVMIFGGRLTRETSFRIDSDNLGEAIQAGITYYNKA
jgi:hypothetical protein